MQPQVRADGDHGAAGIVDSFAQQVLPETALFTFQRITQRFKGPLVGPGYHPAVPAVVKKDIHRFLQHPFFIADDDIGSLEIDQTL